MTKLAVKPIDNSADVIDSRDVIERIEWLECQDSLDDDESEELKHLKALASEGADYAPDWKYGAALIRCTYFKEYAQELADDLGLIKADVSWPYDCIDWDEAARQLKFDYTEIEFNGVSYFVR